MIKLKNLLKEQDPQQLQVPQKIEKSPETKPAPETSEESNAPAAITDPAANAEARKVAIDKFGYGPENPNNPSVKFWKNKVRVWKLQMIDEAKARRCNSCKYFNTSYSISKPEVAQNIDQEAPVQEVSENPFSNSQQVPQKVKQPSIEKAPVEPQQTQDQEPAISNWDKIEAGKLGYCTAHKFVAAGSRVCYSFKPKEIG